MCTQGKIYLLYSKCREQIPFFVFLKVPLQWSTFWGFIYLFETFEHCILKCKRLKKKSPCQEYHLFISCRRSLASPDQPCRYIWKKQNKY